MSKHNRTGWVLGVLVVLLSSAWASAQQLGTVYLDFNGAAGTPQGTVSALDASIFPQAAATPFTTAQLRSAILDAVRVDYAGLSVNVVAGNLTTGADDEPTGTFTRLVVGNTGTLRTGSLGVADQIDFRNKNLANIVSVLANTHASPPVGGAGATYTLAQATQFLTNTSSHELGHVLGLMHSDVVATYAAGANVAAGQLAVRQNELMKAVQADADAFRDLSFGAYSKTKFEIDNGINVQRETGTATFVIGSSADPARDATDSGNTVAAATSLLPDENGRATVLGSLAAADTSDLFKFTGVAGQKVTGEIFSQAIAGAGNRLADPVDTQLRLLDSAGTIVPGQTVFDTNTDFDGSTSSAGNAADFGSDQLLFSFTLPTTGTYAFRIAQSGTDASGQYEFLALIPEPAGLALALAFAPLLARRQQRR